MVFPWSLSDSKSSQVSRTLLSILAVPNNAAVWILSTRPPASKSSSPLNSPLVSVPNAPITIGIIVTCMFHGFQFPSKVQALILLFIFFQFYSVVSRDSKVHNFSSSLFLLIIIMSGCLAEIRWSVLFRRVRYNPNTVVYWLLYSSHTSHHPSQISCLPWISYATQKLMLDSCKVVEKLSEAFHTFLGHFSKFKTEFYCISFF